MESLTWSVRGPKVWAAPFSQMTPCAKGPTDKLGKGCLILYDLCWNQCNKSVMLVSRCNFYFDRAPLHHIIKREHAFHLAAQTFTDGANLATLTPGLTNPCSWGSEHVYPVLATKRLYKMASDELRLVKSALHDIRITCTATLPNQAAMPWPHQPESLRVSPFFIHMHRSQTLLCTYHQRCLLIWNVFICMTPHHLRLWCHCLSYEPHRAEHAML